MRSAKCAGVQRLGSWFSVSPFRHFPFFALWLAVYPFILFSIYPLSYPNEHLAVFVHGQLFDFDEFFLEGVKHVIAQVKLQFQCPIRYPSLALEPGECLRHHFRKLHALPHSLDDLCS